MHIQGKHNIIHNRLTALLHLCTLLMTPPLVRKYVVQKFRLRTFNTLRDIQVSSKVNLKLSVDLGRFWRMGVACLNVLIHHSINGANCCSKCSFFIRLLRIA